MLACSSQLSSILLSWNKKEFNKKQPTVCTASLGYSELMQGLANAKYISNSITTLLAHLANACYLLVRISTGKIPSFVLRSFVRPLIAIDSSRAALKSLRVKTVTFVVQIVNF